jgi:hypothetical protein
MMPFNARERPVVECALSRPPISSTPFFLSRWCMLVIHEATGMPDI